MIIWIASYPKSGNTWVRSLLTAYLYSENGIFNFDLLSKIKQFPDRKYFEYFLDNFSDIKKISEYWIAAQERINLYNDGVTFFKTHSALCVLENHPFTNRFNTKAAIYVVRDPRNVITSLSNHYSLNIKESFAFIKEYQQILMKDKYGQGDYAIATVLGSWGDHYNSWLNMKFAPIKIIKYEDLISDPENTFKSILNFLSKLMEIKIDEKKIENAISSCHFDRLSDKEKKEGFPESPISKKNNEKLKFFHLGKKNNWKILLDPKIEKKIREIFNKEMIELGYIGAGEGN